MAGYLMLTSLSGRVRDFATSALRSLSGLKPGKDDLRTRFCPAIRAKRFIQFHYGVGRRARLCVVEPYCYGVLPDGEETLLCYQVSGHGKWDVPVGWKLYRPSLMTDLQVTGEGFAGRQSGPGYDSRHCVIRTIYCQISPEKTDGSELKEPAEPEPDREIAPPSYEEPARPPAPALGHNELMKRFQTGSSSFHGKETGEGPEAK